jgi:hypothetical protein
MFPVARHTMQNSSNTNLTAPTEGNLPAILW